MSRRRVLKAAGSAAVGGTSALIGSGAAAALELVGNRLDQRIVPV